MALLWVLYGLTAVVSFLAGTICWKKHSIYPDTSTGYRFGLAMASEVQWNAANVLAGKLCIGMGILSFLVTPILLCVLNATFLWRLGIYFIMCLLWIVVVWIVPQWWLQRKYPVNRL